MTWTIFRSEGRRWVRAGRLDGDAKHVAAQLHGLAAGRPAKAVTETEEIVLYPNKYSARMRRLEA